MPHGPSGSTCQRPCFAALRKSAKRYASAPKSPTPPREGSEVGCSRIPEARSKGIEKDQSKRKKTIVDASGGAAAAFPPRTSRSSSGFEFRRDQELSRFRIPREREDVRLTA